MVLTTHTTKNKEFKTYILKVLKQVHPDSQINATAKQQLAGYLDVVARSIVKKAHELLTLEDKKTFNTGVVKNAINISLPGELAEHAVKEGAKSTNRYLVGNHGQKEKPISKTGRAGLKLSVSLIRKYFQGYSLRISEATPVYLAAAIEYIMAELLELSGNVARNAKAVTIKNRHLFLAIQNDEDFSELTRRNNIIMLGTGVMPDAPKGITEEEKAARKSAKNKRDKAEAKKLKMTVKDFRESKKGKEKKRRYNPGTVSKREVTKFQKSTELLIRKEPFRRVCKEIIQGYTSNAAIRFPEHAITNLQEFVESQIVDLFESARNFSVHAGRKSVGLKDIMLAWRCSAFSNSGSAETIKFTFDGKKSKITPKLSGNIAGVTKPAIERLARRGGVSRLSATVYEDIRSKIRSMVQIIISHCLSIITSNKTRTITSEVIRLAGRFMGFNLLVVEHEKKKKSAKKGSEESGTSGKSAASGGRKAKAPPKKEK